MITHTARIVIRRALPDVFTAVSELDENLSGWARGVVAVDRASPGPTAKGTRFVVVAGVGRLRLRSSYRVLAHERDAVFAGRGHAGPLRFVEHYTFAPGKGGVTVVEYATEMRGRGGFRFLEWIFAGMVRSMIDRDLVRLRRRLEMEPTVPRRDEPLPEGAGGGPGGVASALPTQPGRRSS